MENIMTKSKRINGEKWNLLNIEKSYPTPDSVLYSLNGGDETISLTLTPHGTVLCFDTGYNKTKAAFVGSDRVFRAARDYTPEATEAVCFEGWIFRLEPDGRLCLRIQKKGVAYIQYDED